MTNLEDPVPKIDILSSAILSVKVRHKYLHEKKFSAAGKKSTPHVYVQPLEVERHHPETLSSKPISVQHLESLYSRKKTLVPKIT